MLHEMRTLLLLLFPVKLRFVLSFNIRTNNMRTDKYHYPPFLQDSIHKTKFTVYLMVGLALKLEKLLHVQTTYLMIFLNGIFEKYQQDPFVCKVDSPFAEG